MVAIEPLTGARVPDQTDGPLGGLQIANAVEDLAPYSVPRFGTISERDAKYAQFVAAGGVIEDGMTCWCDAPGSYYDRLSGVWVPRARVLYNTNAIDDTAVPATARVLRLRRSALATIGNIAGGFNVPFGFAFTKLMAVALWPGDMAAELAYIRPLVANHSLTTGHGQAFRSDGSYVPNGSVIRVEVDVVGYIL